MSGEVKTFFDNWNLKFRLSQERRMVNKVGGVFATGASISSGKEITILTIVGAMLVNQMIIVSGGGGFAQAQPRDPPRRALTTTNWQTLVTWASASPRLLLQSSAAPNKVAGIETAMQPKFRLTSKFQERSTSRPNITNRLRDLLNVPPGAPRILIEEFGMTFQYISNPSVNEESFLIPAFESSG
jgi:hypothetical protein